MSFGMLIGTRVSCLSRVSFGFDKIGEIELSPYKQATHTHTLLLTACDYLVQALVAVTSLL